MTGFNRVFLLGYLGAEPETHVARNGKSYVRLSVSSHRAWKREDGETETRTMWHRVNVFGKTADVCQNYLHKGSALAVEGYLSRYTFEKDDGSEVSTDSIIAQQVHFISPRSSGASLNYDVAPSSASFAAHAASEA